MRKTLIFFITAVGLFLYPSLFAQKNSALSAVVDGHKMYYQVKGHGSPTIVLEAGGDDNHLTWRNIFDPVSKFTTVFSYDRPGYLSSEPAQSPRTYKQIATDLHELLQKAGLRSPYVLAGHSFGGALIRAFANLYPDEVSGIVLIDPVNENQFNGVPKEVLKNLIAQQDSVVLKSGAKDNEWKWFREDALNGLQELRSLTIPNVPVYLLVAGKSGPPIRTNNMIDWYQSTLSKLDEASVSVIPYSGHYIHYYDPNAVLNAIKRVMYPDALTILQRTLGQRGVDSCIRQYTKLKTYYPKEFLGEDILNNLGYLSLGNHDSIGAIKLFALNVSLFPESYNVYDSLGEAYMVAGNKREAIKNYARSLALNPQNLNAQKRLKKLKEN
jgi:pimeloyl-ACP methyl ester carboxylesterase